MNQSIRIIGGQFRGKKLSFPDIEGLRPTPDRVRETLFNWLMNTIHGARCLDAFAGSGALGFEAFSRGASRVVLIEKAPKAYANLQKIASSFNSSKLSVMNKDACLYLQQSNESFDLIFLDPPFSQDHLLGCINTLVHSSILIPGGLVYIESPQEVVLNPETWEQVKLKKAGQVVYGLYRKKSFVQTPAPKIDEHLGA